MIINDRKTENKTVTTKGNIKTEKMKNTIITNPETIDAIREGRRLLGKTKGYKDFEDFWKVVMDE